MPGHSLMRYFDTSSRTRNKNIAEAAGGAETLAEYWDVILPEGAEKTVAMRKLLEAKDAACRSALDLPEGE